MTHQIIGGYVRKLLLILTSSGSYFYMEFTLKYLLYYSFSCVWSGGYELLGIEPRILYKPGRHRVLTSIIFFTSSKYGIFFLYFILTFPCMLPIKLTVSSSLYFFLDILVWVSFKAQPEIIILMLSIFWEIIPKIYVKGWGSKKESVWTWCVLSSKFVLWLLLLDPVVSFLCVGMNFKVLSPRNRGAGVVM